MTKDGTESLPPFANLVDLAAERLGGTALSASDEFFAPRENLLKSGRGVYVPDKYTDRGKWMDGWETRRRRTPGHDWCVVRLGLPGVVRGVDIDTNHFEGNYPESASVEAAAGGPQSAAQDLEWFEVLPAARLAPSSRNLFTIDDARRWTHVRLNIYPDGGVARFRVFGFPVPRESLEPGRVIDLACVANGGAALLCSDQCFGHMSNMLMPGRPVNMGDGWETRRRRGPGFDWAIVRLGAKATLDRIEVDTSHFKGNYPGQCSVEACLCDDDLTKDFTPENCSWSEVVTEQPLQPDHVHEFQVGTIRGPFTHVRLNIYPDGGVARFRVFGRPFKD